MPTSTDDPIRNGVDTATLFATQHGLLGAYEPAVVG